MSSGCDCGIVAFAALVEEDNLATEAVNFVAHLLTQRCDTMIYFTLCYPMGLAELATSDETLRRSGMRTLKYRFLAFEYCLTLGVSWLAKPLRRSFFRSRFMQAIVHFGRKYNWDYCTQIQEMVFHLFRSILNEKMIEDLNRVVRDRHQDVKRGDPEYFSTWSIAPASGTFANYKRDEITADANMPIDILASCDETLHTYKYNNGDVEELDLTELLTSKCEKLDHKTLRESVPEQALFEYLYQLSLDNKDVVAQAESLWRVGLLPVHKVIGSTTEVGRYYFVLRVYAYNALVWPMTWIPGTQRIAFCESPDRLEFIHVTNFDHWKVLESDPISPLHCRLLGSPKVGLSFHVGRTVALERWAASEGYGFVSEATRNRLHAALPKYAEEASPTMLPEEVCMDLMRAQDPDITEVCAEQVLRRSALNQTHCGDDGSSPSIDIGDLTDTGTLDAKDDLADMLGVSKAKKKELEARFKNVSIATKSHFHRFPMTGKAKKLAKRTETSTIASYEVLHLATTNVLSLKGRA